MAGTLTITSPSTDSASGYSSTSIPVTWSFAGSPGSTTQTQYRVTWQQTGSSTLVGDTGTVASSSTSYTVTGLASGYSYDVWVYVVDSTGTTTSAKRVVVTNYARSLPPILNFAVDPTESVTIVISNPTDSSARPIGTANTVYRRVSGSGSDWTRVGSTGQNGTVVDYFPRSATLYDYFARTDSGADSAIYTVTTPQVTGFWMHDPNNVSGTLAHYVYTDGTTETMTPDEQVLQFVGRTYGVVETGEAETQTLAISATVSLADPGQSAQVEWWRARKRAKAVLIYRDGRGRSIPGRLVGPLTINPQRHGTVITCMLQRVDYTASTVTIPDSQYSQGSSNDGGFGVGGFGVNGFGY